MASINPSEIQVSPQNMQEPEFLLGSILSPPAIGSEPRNVQEPEFLLGKGATSPAVAVSPIFQVCPYGYG